LFIEFITVRLSLKTGQNRFEPDPKSLSDLQLRLIDLCKSDSDVIDVASR
jgi:hypothetical protein